MVKEGGGRIVLGMQKERGFKGGVTRRKVDVCAVFQFFRSMPTPSSDTLSRFWNAPHNAGPTLWDLARFWDRDPRPLRPQNRPRPPPFQTWSEPHRLTPEDAEEIAAFWRRHYGGADWWLDAKADWVERILREPDCWTLGVRDTQHSLIATLVCRSLLPDGGRFCVGDGVSLGSAYIIEGLCVAPAWRGHHLAGWLIAWIDYLRGQTGPHLFVWSRETRMPTYQTNITCDTYAYVKILDLHVRDLVTGGAEGGEESMIPVDWSTFRSAWDVDALLSPTTLLPTVLPRHGDLRVFYNKHSGQIVVFSDTHRCTRGEHPVRIWEVVWCGVWATDRLRLSEEGDDFRESLEMAALHLGEDGLVFATSAVHQGGCTAAWGRPWTYGRSGFHTSYLYNFMPPAFWTCRLFLLRNEL